MPKGVQPPFVLRLLITLQVAHVDIELIPGPQKPAAGRNLGLKPPLLSLSFNGGQLLLNMQRFFPAVGSLSGSAARARCGSSLWSPRRAVFPLSGDPHSISRINNNQCGVDCQTGYSVNIWIKTGTAQSKLARRQTLPASQSLNPAEIKQAVPASPTTPPSTSHSASSLCG